MPRRRVCFLAVGILQIVSMSVFASPYWCPDLVNDDKIDFFDFAVLAENWGQSGMYLEGDLDDNGAVDIDDLRRLANWWLEDYAVKSADFNFDTNVDFEDFAELANKWLSDSGDAGWDDIYDLDESGEIDIYDLRILAERWLDYEERIIYVDEAANTGGDGSSWHNAFNYLQDAISYINEFVAVSATAKLYVAEGVYRPDANSENPNGTGLRTATFQLPEGVEIYGGFPAGGGPLNNRDWVNNETILSGDIGIEEQPYDNCYNVVVGANDVTIDGLIIADGYADDTGDRARGAGMRIDEVNNVTVVNCVFADNYARYDGGGIYNYESEVFITNCIFSNNTSNDDGGGIYSSDCDGTFTNCTFSDNWAINRGGGMYNYQSGFEIINCLFYGNDADANGGAVFNGYQAVKMINCTIADNSATYSGGGVYNTYSASTLSNCIVWNNGQAIYNYSSNFHVSFCDIEGSGGSGAGWNAAFGLDEGNNIDIVPQLDDAFALQEASPCIDAGDNSELPEWVISDIEGNARFVGPVDMGAYEYGELDMTQDSDGDGMVDWWEYRFGLNPYDANDASEDLDGDGLNNGDEYENGCDIRYFDSDGDLLSDGWEVLYGLNPLVSDVIDVNDGNNVYADTDGDGLDALKEVMFSTSPINADSDGDGASDGIEVAQGSLPMDASDLGLAPSPDQICELRLTVGDWSSSNSERYDLIVGPITHQVAQFGEVTAANYEQFRLGNRYEVRIEHIGTIYYMDEADYDYTAEIEAVSLPAGVIMVIDDPEGILGTHGEPNTMNTIFFAEGKVAYVNLIKVNFLEAIDQIYGWDNYSAAIPWKSVKVGDTDKCIAQIGPAEKANSIYFRSLSPGNVSVSPAQASSSPQNVNLAGVAEGEAEVWSRFESVDGTNMSQLSVAAYQQDEYTLGVRVINEEDDDLQVIAIGNGKPNQTAITAGADGILNSIPGGDDTIEGTTITTGADGIRNSSLGGDDIAVIGIGKGKPNEICVSSGANAFRDSVPAGDDQISGDNITTGADGICNTTADNTDDISTDPYTEGALADYLNNVVYNQAVVRWTQVVKLPPMTVNFDLNRDGFIDVTSWPTSEMSIIMSQCDDPNREYVVFVVNNPSDGSAGFMQFNQKWGFIHPGTGCGDMLQVTAHELGHGMGGLRHTTDPSNTISPYPKDDPVDLMHPYCGSSSFRLRKGQVSFVQGKK